MTAGAVVTVVVCLLTIVRRRKSVSKIYLSEGLNNN